MSRYEWRLVVKTDTGRKLTYQGEARSHSAAKRELVSEIARRTRYGCFSGGKRGQPIPGYKVTKAEVKERL